MELKVSTQEKEGAMQVSKARLFQVLLDVDEMKGLCSALGPFFLLCVGRPLSWDQIEVSVDQFLEHYAHYIEGIATGKLVDETKLFRLFSTGLTSNLETFYAQRVGSESTSNARYLIKAKAPIIQLQRSHFLYSSGFHVKVIAKESITWGVAFSYPQLYLDPHTQQIEKVTKQERFPNTALFEILAKWIRNHTLPTPFIVKEGEASKLVRQPLRLGRGCFSWINNHPALKMKNLYVPDLKTTSKADF